MCDRVISVYLIHRRLHSDGLPKDMNSKVTFIVKRRRRKAEFSGTTPSQVPVQLCGDQSVHLPHRQYVQHTRTQHLHTEIQILEFISTLSDTFVIDLKANQIQNLIFSKDADAKNPTSTQQQCKHP